MGERGQDSKKVCIGAGVGAIFVALCCVTPVLVAMLGLVGLSALTPYLDYVLLPAFVVLVIAAVMAYRKWKQATTPYKTRSQ